MTIVRRYRAPRVPGWVLVLLAVSFACLTILRGVGWITAEPGASLSPVVVDGLTYARLSPTGWGSVMVCVGVLVIAAYLTRVHVLVFLTHGLAAATYLAVTVGLTQAALDLGSGWQIIGPVLGGCVWHVALAALTGPLPPSTTGAAGDTD